MEKRIEWIQVSLLNSMSTVFSHRGSVCLLTLLDLIKDIWLRCVHASFLNGAFSDCSTILFQGQALLPWCPSPLWSLLWRWWRRRRPQPDRYFLTKNKPFKQNFTLIYRFYGRISLSGFHLKLNPQHARVISLPELGLNLLLARECQLQSIGLGDFFPIAHVANDLGSAGQLGLKLFIAYVKRFLATRSHLLLSSLSS